MKSATKLLERLEIDEPIIQAPMAGVLTPEMAAAVSNAGALGSIGVGVTNAAGAQQMIAAFRARSPRSLNVNVFCHAPARSDQAREARWIPALTAGVRSPRRDAAGDTERNLPQLLRPKTTRRRPCSSP